MANGMLLPKKDMAEANKFGKMEQYTKATGEMARLMAGVGLSL